MESQLVWLPVAAELQLTRPSLPLLALIHLISPAAVQFCNELAVRTPWKQDVDMIFGLSSIPPGAVAARTPSTCSSRGVSGPPLDL